MIKFNTGGGKGCFSAARGTKSGGESYLFSAKQVAFFTHSVYNIIQIAKDTVCRKETVCKTNQRF